MCIIECTGATLSKYFSNFYFLVVYSKSNIFRVENKNHNTFLNDLEIRYIHRYTKTRLGIT